MLGFIEIPAGSLMMGSDEEANEELRASPLHKVTLPIYYIACDPDDVEFSAFVSANGYTSRHSSS